MHQLHHALIQHGLKSQIACYGVNNNVKLNGQTLTCESALPEGFIQAYKDYAPIYCSEIELNKEETLCIFPEAKAGLAFGWQATQKAIWWLSVDNFKITHPHLLNERTLHRLLQDESIMHLYQSNYAHDFLRQHGARSTYPLYDYTSKGYSDTKPSGYIGKKSVDFAFFPKKGKPLADTFLKTGGGHLSQVAIEGFTQEQVKEALGSTTLYLDFGHQPGKDRVPREAACMGNIIFLHEQGSARFFGDHPLHSDYIFTTLDVHNGHLLSKVKQVLNNPQPHFERQAYYRRRIQLEREEFSWQVKSIFGTA